MFQFNQYIKNIIRVLPNFNAESERMILNNFLLNNLKMKTPHTEENI